MSPQLPPEGISQSAWDEAREVVADTQGCNCSHCVGTIARAIDAATARERERCALIAEATDVPAHFVSGNLAYGYKHGAGDTKHAIAAAIRQGSQPSNAIPLKGVVR